VGGFVILVVVGLVISYIGPLPKSSSNTKQSLYFSQISLISGSASSASLNMTCKGDSQLDIYVTNTSPNTIYMINVTISSSGHGANSAVLIPLSNGCLPVSEDNPAIQPGSNDLEIITYPSVLIHPYTSWNVTVDFSNGQKITQLSLASPLAP
jgi:hypothetical protein